MYIYTHVYTYIFIYIYVRHIYKHIHSYIYLCAPLPQIVTGSFDKTAKLWDSETGQLLHTLRGHTTEIVCLAFDPHGAVVATVTKRGLTLSPSL